MALRLQWMKIKKFKNFGHEEMVLLTDSSMICIIGENGSGKSCIVDALSFVFGASKENMRISRYQELITYPCDENEQDDYCFVEVFMINLPHEHSKMHFRRQIVPKDGRVICQYKTTQDKAVWQTVSRKEYLELLSSIGFNMEMKERFIVRQANTASIAQSSPKALLSFCESLIGTHVLKSRIQTLEEGALQHKEDIKTLETTTGELSIDINALTPTVERISKWVADQKDLDEDTLQLRHRKVTLQTMLIEYLHADMIQLEQQLSSITMIIDKTEVARRELSDAKIRQENDITSLKDNVNAVSLEYDTHSREMIGMKTEADDHARNYTVYKKRMTSILKQITTFDKKRIKLEATLVEHKLKDNDKENNMEDSLSFTGDAHAKITELKIVLDSKLKIDTQIIAHEKQLKELQERSVDLKMQIDTTEEEQNACVNEMTKVKSFSKTKKEMMQKIKKLDITLKEKKSVQKNLQTKLKRMRNEERPPSLHHKAHNAYVEIRNSFDSTQVVGLLWEVVTADTKYLKPLHAVLGSRLNQLIVQNRAIAGTAANIFRKSSSGAVTCCIFEEFKAIQGTCCRSLKDSHVVPLCSVATSEAVYTGIVHAYCRNWMVVKNIQEAEEWKRSHRQHSCVTLTGELFFATGEIQTTLHVREERRFAYRQLTDASAFVGACVNPNKEKIKVMENKIQEEDVVVLNASMELKQAHEELTRQSDAHALKSENIKMKFDSLKKTLAWKKKSSKVLNTEMNRLSVDEGVQTFKIQREELQIRLLALEKWLSDREFNKKSYEKILKAAADAELLKEAVSRNEYELVCCNEKLSSFKDRKVTNDSKMTELNDQCNTCNESLLAKEKQVDTILSSRNEVQSQLAELETTFREITIQQRKQDKEHHALTSKQQSLKHDLKQVQCEKMKLVEENTNQMKDEIEDSSTAFELDVEEIRTKLKVIADGEVSLSRIQIRQRRIRENIPEDDVARIAALHEERSSVQTTISTLQSARKELVLDIQKLDNERFNKLISTLHEINKHLAKIYRNINEHGDCYLKVSADPSTLYSEGITFQCKPQEGQWQPFRALSGGQQVLCALSLTLALQRIFPCPLYICDEIDAALDTINVALLAKLLVTHAKESKSQFLVVSHRAGMWDHMATMLGVHGIPGHAKTITWSDIAA